MYFVVLLVMGNALVGLMTAMWGQILSDYVIHDYTGMISHTIIAYASATLMNLTILWFFGYFKRTKKDEGEGTGGKG